MKNMISFFPENKTRTAGSDFTILDAITLSNVNLDDFWSITASILIWMAMSYAVVYLVAALVVAITIRRHPYFVAFTVVMSVMSLVGPATVGVITSMVLAFCLKTSEKDITNGYCCILGIVQTVFLIVVSFSRLLGTL